MANSPSYEPEDDAPTCPKCGAELEWVPCPTCHGDCAFDLHEEDGVNYAPGEEFEVCDECRGQGGFLDCPDTSKHAASALAASGEGAGR